jgi:hypothetical protein
VSEQRKALIHDCHFPNRRMQRPDGTTYPISCELPQSLSSINGGFVGMLAWLGTIIGALLCRWKD